MTIKWTASREEVEILVKIAERAVELAKKAGWDGCLLRDVIMDVEACHCNGCPLDLMGLLTAPDGTFGHDVFGIMQNIDRKTGQLTNSFVPRCAVPEVTT